MLFIASSHIRADFVITLAADTQPQCTLSYWLHKLTFQPPPPGPLLTLFQAYLQIPVMYLCLIFKYSWWTRNSASLHHALTVFPGLVRGQWGNFVFCIHCSSHLPSLPHSFCFVETHHSCSCGPIILYTSHTHNTLPRSLSLFLSSFAAPLFHAVFLSVLL